MDRSEVSTTCLFKAMIARSGKEQQEAWEEFVKRYGRQIWPWCRARGLSEHDADDFTQRVFLRVVRSGKTFDRRKGPARTWLWSIVGNAIKDFVREKRREGTSEVTVLESLENERAQEDLVKRLQEEFDLEHLDEAVRRVKRRVRETTWLAWEYLQAPVLSRELGLTEINGMGLSGPQAAARLGIPTSTVYVYSNRVEKMLKEEVARLQEAPEPTTNPPSADNEEDP
jgi:RNA polymerase sigma factor (sigma-70 family)